MIKNRIRAAAKALLGKGGASVTANVGGIWTGYTDDALQLAEIIDCKLEDLCQPQQHPERVATEPADRICAWYLPCFDNPFYGGVMTILRLAESLKRRYGMHQRFLICGSADAAHMQGMLGKAFPALKDSEVLILDSGEAIKSIPVADYSVATLWTTAYVLLNVRNTGLKFYMMQDFEPAFYPAGSTYAQAELTYRFGFLGICNTQTLKRIYEEEYGGSAVLLQPNVDRSVFFRDSAGRDDAALVKRLFYYARPGTPRNGFELAAAGLRRVKARFGEQVQILCAGTGWNPADYGLQDVVESIGMLPYRETANLYRSCHVGFVMMMTKHPSYLPFELMACGTTVVTNYNEANTWLLRDGSNCLLAPPSASCLAQTLIFALENHQQLQSIRDVASEEIQSMPNWDQSLERVADFMQRPILKDFVPSFGERFFDARKHS
ncbi:glycosyltransferase family 1 protein [Pseudoxanthomonas winnipegensis]|uniref:glycosyltransferase family 4 protein n=1 Tax=Pseudoxanthomonas winnipegensis TaxID=2480810 RepID=UPI00102DCAA3|nr:glycosyltransferase family 4 protein [Pseudoxanthomonas winnipegensis]TAA44350.1 glycosyltransferase family 1 protein [Pseudoxanthomonas winnipegensis]